MLACHTGFVDNPADQLADIDDLAPRGQGAPSEPVQVKQVSKQPIQLAGVAGQPVQQVGDVVGGQAASTTLQRVVAKCAAERSL